MDVVLHLMGAPLDRELILAAVHARARGLRDLDPRLTRARLQRDHVAAVGARALGIEVAAPQLVGSERHPG